MSCNLKILQCLISVLIYSNIPCTSVPFLLTSSHSPLPFPPVAVPIYENVYFNVICAFFLMIMFEKNQHRSLQDDIRVL